MLSIALSSACFWRYTEVYQVDTSHPQAKPMFPFDIKTAKCCPGRRCYMSFTNSNGGRGFEEGIPSELKYDEIVLQQTSKCYRQPGSITLYKYYEPVIVELSRSCHCTFPPPNQQVIASTPQPDGCDWYKNSVLTLMKCVNSCGVVSCTFTDHIMYQILNPSPLILVNLSLFNWSQ